MCDSQQPQAECPHVVTCGSCNGSGRDTVLPLSQACEVCRGIGKVRVP
ncbi:hypothetical protein ABZW49_20190 [Nonomuraea wenchangensis]